jgi:undecaprenyl-diphosphatase
VIFLKALFLGLVEGVTEFLPISSTGHMILVDEFMKLTNDKAFDDAFMVIIQLPAILAVIVYFWKAIWPFGADEETRNATILMWTRIVVAFLPAGVIGLLLHKRIEAHLFNGLTVSLALVIGGIAIILVDRSTRRGPIASVRDIDYKTALGIGFFQCLAMIPGTSRSAATIIGAMLLGAQRAAAAEFSFFLAIPTMVAATGLKVVKGGAHFTGSEWGLLAVGSVVSFVVAYGVIAFFMDFIRSRDFKPFGYYRIVLGLAVLGYFYFHGGFGALLEHQD